MTTERSNTPLQRYRDLAFDLRGAAARNRSIGRDNTAALFEQAADALLTMQSETAAPEYDLRGEVPILKSPTDKKDDVPSYEHYEQLGRERGDSVALRAACDALDKLRALQSAVARRYANPFKVLTSEWQTDRGENQVTCHSRMVDGVLCRWWGDDEPPGTAKIDAAASAQSATLASTVPEYQEVPCPKCGVTRVLPISVPWCALDGCPSVFNATDSRSAK